MATSVRELSLTKLDLMLLHGAFKQTGAQRESVWRGLFDAKVKGLVRYIGVSNYDRGQVEELMAATGVKPAVVQLEYNPWVPNATVLSGVSCAPSFRLSSCVGNSGDHALRGTACGRHSRPG